MTEWTATEVLDTYAGLIRRLRNPSPHLADFTAYLMNTNLRGEGKRSQYYPVEPAGDVTARQGGEFASYLGTGLVGAPVYQVTSGMCDAVDAMFERTMAEEAQIIYEADLPATAGFAWLDRQIELESGDGGLSRVQGISWAAHSVLAEEGTLPVLRVALWILASDVTSDDGRTRVDAAEAAEITEQLGVLTLLYTDIWLLNRPLGRGPKSVTTLVAYLNMLWMMLQMEITSIDRAPVSRSARRRAQRDTICGDVLVITLRRAHASAAGDTPGRRDVEWSHRWLVQTHYRHHVAPPQDSWHPVIPTTGGKRCAVCSGTVSYIPPYIKGPDGAPLKIRRRLYRLSR